MQPVDLPNLELAGGWDDLFTDRGLRILETEVLPTFLVRQRWFAGKALQIESIAIKDATVPQALTKHSALLLVEVTYVGGETDTYVVPLSMVLSVDTEDQSRAMASQVAARLQTSEGPGILLDGIAADDFCTALLNALVSGDELLAVEGVFSALPTSALSKILEGTDHHLQPFRNLSEQSNTSVRYGDRLILKLIRKIQSGENPEVEMGRFLTERTGFPNSPKLTGVIEYRSPDASIMSIGILQELIDYQSIGWEHTLDELSMIYESLLTDPQPLPASLSNRTPLELAGSEELPGSVHFGATLSAARTLGRRTAELHQALASCPDDPDFRPEPVTVQDLETLSLEIRTQVESALSLLRNQLANLPINQQQDADLLLRSLELLQRPLIRLAGMSPSGQRIRVHGDYHLGQVLWSSGDFMIIDFEGEPLKPIKQRRTKHLPIKDVVGMLRSYSYAAFAGLLKVTEGQSPKFDQLVHWSHAWELVNSAAFLQSYLEVALPTGLLPQKQEDLGLVLECYTLDKALYELQYELNNRPDWVGIPLRAIIRMIEHASGRNHDAD